MNLSELFKQLKEIYPEVVPAMVKEGFNTVNNQLLNDYSNVHTFNNALYKQTLPTPAYTSLKDFYIKNRM